MKFIINIHARRQIAGDSYLAVKFLNSYLLTSHFFFLKEFGGSNKSCAFPPS